MTLVEYFLLFLLFFTGYLFVTAFTGPERVFRNLVAAFPMGCCLWGAATFLTAALPLLPKDAYGLNLIASLSLTGLIAMATLLVSIKRHSIPPCNTLAIVYGFILLSLLYWFFMQLNISVITGDSLSHIHPQEGMKTMGNVRGFNSTLAALAGLAGQDRYFFSYHSIFAVALLLLMGECIFYEVKSASSGLGPALCSSIVGPTLMASCHMTAIHTFYVNNHMLVAVLIILALSLLIGRNKSEQDLSGSSLPMVSLAVISISFLCLLRLEGLLIALLLLVITLGNSGVNHTVRVQAFLLLALLSTPFQLFLIFSTAGKVSAANLVVILLATLLLPMVFALKKPGWVLHLQDQANMYAILGLGIGIGLFFLMNFNKMMRRLGWFVHNTLDESYWGFVHQTLIVAVLALLGLRFFFHNPKMTSLYRRIDLLLLFYIASLLLIVFMLKFHGARLGWSDSQNRMLIHFLPAGILWASIQAGLGFVKNVRDPV